MKLTYDDKVQIYELRKQGRTFKEISNIFGITIPNLQYMIKLIDRYGIEIVKKGKKNFAKISKSCCFKSKENNNSEAD